MNIYIDLANKLLLMRNHTFYNSPKNGRFGFNIKHDYSGLMAQPAKTGRYKGVIRAPKQGLFDIIIITGDRYESVTHRELLSDLLLYSTEDNCLRVWRGEDPRNIGRNQNEKEVLITLALLMFEQEVNWGRHEWQKSSVFNPLIRNPTRKRPRDMIMGYVRQAFAVGVEKIKYWRKVSPGTVCFTDKEESPFGFQTYPIKYKRHFTELEAMNGTEPVMLGDILVKYKELAAKYPNNPKYE